MWSLEDHDPGLRPVITVVAVLDRSPGIDHLRSRAVALTAHLPRLREVIVAGPRPRSRPRWVPDPDFDPAWHVRAARAPDSTGLDGVLAAVAPTTTEALDRCRPPWQMTLMEDIDAGGRAALIVRLHHVCADGVGALRLAAVLFDLAPGAGPPSAPSGSRGRPGSPGPTGWRQLLDDAGASVSRGVDAARRAWPAVAATARDAWADPQPRAQATVDLVRSVARLAAPGTVTHSPLLTGRSRATRLAGIDLDLDRMAERGREAGGTINDVFVAGLLDGLERYHRAHDHRPATLRIGVPINMRSDGTPDDVTNAFAPARITAPLQIRAPLARIAAVHHLVLRERHQPANDVLAPLAGVVQRLPLARTAMASALGTLDAMASNVAGPPVPLWLGPARVEALYPFGPRSGSGLNVTLLSQERTARVGIHLDPAAAPDTDAFLRCLGEGFAATLG